MGEKLGAFKAPEQLILFIIYTLLTLTMDGLLVMVPHLEEYFILRMEERAGLNSQVLLGLISPLKVSIL